MNIPVFSCCLGTHALLVTTLVLCVLPFLHGKSLYAKYFLFSKGAVSEMSDWLFLACLVSGLPIMMLSVLEG